MSLITKQSSKYQSGFTLLEALVALLVFSIGMLGLAGLQASGLRSNNNALLRTMATLQAYDMAERLRANAQGVNVGLYNAILSSSGTGAPPPDCITAGCTSAQLAVYDGFEWNFLNGQLLPSGRGTVLGPGVNGEFTITVMWDEDRTGFTGTGCGGNPLVDLKCYRINVTP